MEITFSLFNQIPIYSFSIILAIGALIGIHGVVRRALVMGEDVHTYLNLSILILVGSLVGGRTVFVGAHWEYFQDYFVEIPQVWLGGLAWPGAFAGGLLVLTLFALLRRRNIWALGDAIMPLLTAMTISAWLGCWVSGSAYGPKVDSWWGMPMRDMWGEISIRWPLQPLGAFLTVGIAWSLNSLKPRIHTEGLLFTLTFAGISLSLLGLTVLRVDPGPSLYGARLDYWTALVFAVSSLFTALMIYIKASARQPSLEKP